MRKNTIAAMRKLAHSKGRKIKGNCRRRGRTIKDMQIIARSQGGTCLSKKFITVDDKLKWQCKEGHIWYTTPSIVLRGGWCKRCADRIRNDWKRLTIEQMREIAKKFGGKCLSDKYVNSATKLKWQCKKGHIFYSSPNVIKKGYWCPYCSKRPRISLEECKKLASDRGGSCLSNKYNPSKLKWQCKNDHVWETTASHIRLGRWCPYCSGWKKRIEDMQLFAESRDGKCLSKRYIHSQLPLKWQCSKGHIWYASPSNITKPKGTWCPYCSGYKKTIRDMRLLAKFRKGKCLSKEYRGCEVKLRWQCKEGHVWEATLTSILRGTWCPICTAYLSEKICRKYFEEIFREKFPKSRPNWLINRRGHLMELDGFCKSLNLAFEYQGAQHYIDYPFFGKYNDFKTRKEDDNIKKSLCKWHKIILLEVPYNVRYNEMGSYILKLCKKNHLRTPTVNLSRLNYKKFDIYSSDNLDTIKSIAISKGGKCISKHYAGVEDKLRFKCKEGHVWEATPAHIKNGTWCPYCAEVVSYKIADMKRLAKARGGKCLSALYYNAHHNMKWQCKEGHVWEATPTSILRGTWCRICSMKRAGKNGRLSLADAEMLAKSKMGLCISKKYLNANSPLQWQCKEGHIWKAPYHEVKDGGHWCPFCSRNARSNIQECIQFAKQRGGKCLSHRYINARTKLKWECQHGHIWKAIPDSVKRGTWCPYCRERRIA